MFDMENTEEKLYELLLSKSFESLTEEERVWVLKFMTAGEYEHSRKVLRDNADYLSPEKNIIFPSEKIKSRLDRAFEEKHQRKTHSLVFYPVPLWQVAAAVLLLLSCAYFLLRDKESIEAKPTLAVADTVFVEKIIQGKTDTVFIEKEIPSRQKNTAISSPEITPVYKSPSAPIMGRDNIKVTNFNADNSGGSSLEEDTIAGEWMVNIL